MRRDPIVGVVFGEAENLGGERLGSCIVERKAGVDEGKALAAGRDDGRRHIRDLKAGHHPHVQDHGVSTTADSRAHHPTAIVTGKVVGQYLRYGVPIACRAVRQEALGHLTRGVFQPRCGTAELFEPRDRGVEVCLVEDLAAVDQVTFDRYEVDSPPLGVEALVRGPMRRVGVDRSEVAQPMHNLDVGSDVLAELPPGADVFDQLTGRVRRHPTVVDARQVRCGRRQLVPVERGVATRDHRPRACIRGHSAGDVTRVELRDGGIEVVEVERDEREDPLLGVDLDYL